MAIPPPTPPTPPTPPKITIGDAARDAQANTTHTTGDAQAEQQARDSVAQGNGALSKTTTGAAQDGKAQTGKTGNAAARSDAAKGDHVSTSATSVDRGTKMDGQTGADVSNGLDMAQENAALRQQLSQTGAEPPPKSYTAASGVYWAGMIVLAAAVGAFLFFRFFRKKEDAQAAEPSLGERILAHESEPQEAPPPRAHEDLLTAAEQVRRRRTPQGELLPEYTGLTAGEVLERLAGEDHAVPAPSSPPIHAPRPPRRAPAARPAAAKPNVPAVPPNEVRMPPPLTPAPTAAQKDDAPPEGNQPHFEVRV